MQQFEDNQHSILNSVEKLKIEIESLKKERAEIKKWQRDRSLTASEKKQNQAVKILQKTKNHLQHFEREARKLEVMYIANQRLTLWKEKQLNNFNEDYAKKFENTFSVASESEIEADFCEKTNLKFKEVEKNKVDETWGDEIMVENFKFECSEKSLNETNEREEQLKRIITEKTEENDSVSTIYSKW